MHRHKGTTSAAHTERLHIAWANFEDWRGRCLWCGNVIIGKLSQMGRGRCDACGEVCDTALGHRTETRV